MHKVNIELMSSDFQTKNGVIQATLWSRTKNKLFHLSLTNIFTISCILSVLLFLLYLCKIYLRTVLLWLESQNAIFISLTILILFTIVSLPISLGYILLVLANGYLFGIVNGLALTIIGANVGLYVANTILKLLSQHHSIRKLVDNEMADAMMRVLSGRLCFKIVFCARLTPIPFGIQNTMFALSNVNTRIYHLASFLGLVPAQCVGVYIGSSLRSMQDVLESRHISTGTYLLAILQAVIGAGLMLWIGRKARYELMKAMAVSDVDASTLSNHTITSANATNIFHIV